MTPTDLLRAKILLVDDDPGKLLATEAVLEGLGQTVVSVTSGAEALRRLLVDDFALILLDVNMPGLDGFETAELIRQRKRSEHTPIIFLTAFPDDAYAQRGYSLGAVDYILMPPAPDVLRSKVAVFVDLFHKTEQIKRQADERVLLAQEHAARVAAERANRAKSQFLTNMSHELRTPMTTIIGMTDLTASEELTPVLREYVDAIGTSARLLLELLNEILDLSKLEAGRLTLDSAPLSVRRVVEELRQTFGFRAGEKGLEFTATVAEEVPRNLLGDSLRLRQVLINLLTNAIKFTHQGSVSLNVEVESTRADDAWIKFTVTDSGIGIRPEDQERIFAPFTQVDASTARVHTGTGLGLAIASELIRAMGGRRSLASVPGEGSVISFAVPLPFGAAAGAETDADPVDAAHVAEEPARPSLGRAEIPLRILLAEDTRAIQLVVVRTLEKRGHTIDVVGDGQSAISFAGSRPYDVILMDLQMPGMDGFEATAAIRSRPRPTEAPIIALTAHTMVGDRQRCLDAGMEDYLPKPLDLRQLVAAVETHARAASRPRQPARHR